MALKISALQCPNLFRAFPVLFILFLLSLTSACTKPDFGAELQPEGDALNILSTFEVVPRCSTKRIDSIASSGLLQNCAGVYFDPIFGKINASLYAQFRLQLNNINFGENAIADSMILALPYAGAYGDVKKINGLQNFTVHELDEIVETSKVYYSNKVFKIKPDPIGTSGYVVPKLNQEVTIGNTKSFPQLRIPLNASLAERFLDAANLASFENSPNFLDFFKGVKVSSTLFNEIAGQGSIVYFDLLKGARIELYYKNAATDTTLRANFVVNELSVRVNTFQQEYSQEITDALDSFEAGKQFLYNQSTAGLQTVLYFPDILTWKAGRNILINKAELEVSIDESSLGIYPPPLKIDPVTLNNDNVRINIADFAFNNFKPVGGNYLFNEKKYRFTITKYLQEILDGKEDKGLFLFNTAAAINANRVKLKGTEAPEGALRLKIIYQIL